MKKILIMTDFFLPKPLANGVCAYNIGKELTELGYDVHLIAYKNIGQLEKETIDGMLVHRIRPRLFYLIREIAETNIDKTSGRIAFRIAMALNKFKKLVFLPLYPITSITFLRRYYIKSLKLHEENDYSVVLSLYNPIESVISGFLMKKKYPKLKYGLYVLDSFSNSIKIKLLPKSWSVKKGWKWEKKLYTHADRVFNMKCHERHHEKSQYNLYRDKMEILDIPLLREYKPELGLSNTVNYYNSEVISLVYTGTLYAGLREPNYLLKLFEKINFEKELSLHFYSRGDCESILSEYQAKKNNYVNRHGYVEFKEVQKAINAADVLISIGNRNSDMIPSKTFEYISTGKKIIHFYKSKEDSSLPYFRKYKNALLVNETESFDMNLSKVKKFIEEPCIEMKFSEIESIFKINTPLYTAQRIINILD